MSGLQVLCEHISGCGSCVYVWVHTSFCVGALFAGFVFPTRPCMSGQAAGLQGRWQQQFHCCRGDILPANPGGRNHLFRHQIKAEDTPHNRRTHTRCFLRHTCNKLMLIYRHAHANTKKTRPYITLYSLIYLHTHVHTFMSHIRRLSVESRIRCQTHWIKTWINTYRFVSCMCVL